MTPYKTKQKQKQKEKYEFNLNKQILINKQIKMTLQHLQQSNFKFCKNMLQTYCNAIGLGLDGFN